MASINLPSMAHVENANRLLGGARPFDEGNILKLEELKETMMDAGFSAPFKGLLKRTMDEAGELSEAEWADLKKQVGYFKYIANLKKLSLARVSIALDAHKVAKNFAEQGYSDIVDHTPLDGNHIGSLMQAGEEGIIAYREIMDRVELAAERKKCFSVRVKVHGESFTAQLENPDNIEMDIVRRYGLDAEIVAVRPSTRRVPIISSKGVRVALASAVVNYAAGEVGGWLEAEEKGEVKKYNSILRKHGIRPDARMDRVEGFGGVKKELEKAGFLKKKGGKLEMGKDLSVELMRRKKRRKQEVGKMASLLLLSPMFKFYLATSEEGRKRKNLYPSMAVKPGVEQAALFEELGRLEEGLPADRVLMKKLELEGKGLPINGKRLGAAVLVSESGKDAAWAAKYLGMPVKDVESAAKILEKIEKGGRGSEFLRKAR